MLRLMEEGEWPRYADHAWHLAQELQTSSFPTYLDGIKTRDDFEKRVRAGFSDSRDAVMVYQADGIVRGYLHAYHLPKENYASACLFLTENGWQGDMLSELVLWAREKWPGAQLDLGFPTENREACEAVAASGFEPLETSEVCTLRFDGYVSRAAAEGVRRMSSSQDEASFACLHRMPDMFWTAERVLANKANWLVYLHRGDDGDDAALLCRKDEAMPEIFGVFYADAFQRDVCCALYTACLNDLKAAGCGNLVVMIEDRDEVEAICTLGFERRMGYSAYRKRLQ